MLRIKLSITLFNKCNICELTEKEAVYILESLKKAPTHKGSQRPFVCITGYNGMAVHILEGKFEDLPPSMTIKQGVAYHGGNKNICWPIINKNFEMEQIGVFSDQLFDSDVKMCQTNRFYQDTTLGKQSLTSYYSISNAHSVPEPVLLSTPIYEPEFWNSNLNLLINNNCYTYALNVKGVRKSCGKDPNRTPFGNIIKNCIEDDLHIVSSVTESNDKHLIALFASSAFSDISKKKNDYHFFRRDANGEWSHKNGHSNVSNRDFSGQIIKDIMNCDRGRFRNFLCLFNVTARTIEKVTKRV